MVSQVTLMAPDLGQLGEEVVAVEVDTMVVWVVWVLSEAVVVVMVWWKVMFLEEFVVALESVVFSVVVVAVVVMELDVVERWQVVLLKCLMRFCLRVSAAERTRCRWCPL